MKKSFFHEEKTFLNALSVNVLRKKVFKEKLITSQLKVAEPRKRI